MRPRKEEEKSVKRDPDADVEARAGHDDKVRIREAVKVEDEGEDPTISQTTSASGQLTTRASGLGVRGCEERSTMEGT